jgi:hypothetical protein
MDREQGFRRDREHFFLPDLEWVFTMSESLSEEVATLVNRW